MFAFRPPWLVGVTIEITWKPKLSNSRNPSIEIREAMLNDFVFRSLPLWTLIGNGYSQNNLKKVFGDSAQNLFTTPNLTKAVDNSESTFSSRRKIFYSQTNFLDRTMYGNFKVKLQIFLWGNPILSLTLPRPRSLKII